MAEIINLRNHRKKKSRNDKKVAAEENRAKFGRSGSEKSLIDKERKTLDRMIDGAKIETKPDNES